jgi:23S rRNA (adenine2030-N6)-methyltransferase
MFSYRHAFHAGNHADVLKHLVLVAVLRYLAEKLVALTAVDTHAGAGLYRLDSEWAQTSEEAAEGLHQLVQARAGWQGELSPLIQDYLDLVAEFNPKGQWTRYPGSPFVMNHLLREQDKVKLFELMPSDARLLEQHVAQLEAGRRVAVLREDGFEGLKKFLPPPSRRGLVLIDPSYELKTDYARVAATLQDSLKRFPTGTYMVWYPVIGRPEAHDLPRRLRTLTQQASKPWLHATLTIKSGKTTTLPVSLQGDTKAPRPGLPASGVFLINPPYTLAKTLRPALEQLVKMLGQDRHAACLVESGGA